MRRTWAKASNFLRIVRTALPFAVIAWSAQSLATHAQVSFTETVLAPVRPGMLPQTMKIADTVDKFAYVASEKKKFIVATLNGTSAQYDEIEQRTLHFRPEGLGVAFVGRRGADRYLVINNIEKKIDGELIRSGFVPNPAISHNGRHLALVVKKNGKTRVILDGVPGAEYDDVVTLTFSNDSQIVYLAKRNGQTLLIAKGIEDGQLENAGLPFVSPDGTRVAISVKRADGEHLRVNGIDGKPYEKLGSVAKFSPDSKRIAYFAETKTGLAVILDDKEGPSFTSIADVGLFSPDSNRHAYVAIGADNKMKVIEANVEHPAFDAIDGLVFSPNSQRFAYAAAKGKAMFVVVDGVTSKPFEKVDATSLRFSPDSQQLAFVATKAKTTMGVVDNIEVGKLSNLLLPVFSPDGKHIVFVGSSSLLVDGKAVNSGAALIQPNQKLHFFDQTHFRLMGRRNGNFVKVEAAL